MNSLNNSKTNSIFTVGALMCFSFFFIFSIPVATAITWNIDHTTVISNSTEFWITSLGSLGDVNITQFIDGAFTLSINNSWVDSKWCSLNGCIISGSLIVVGNITIGESIHQGNYSIHSISTNGKTIDDVFCVEMPSPDGDSHCKLVIQPGGSGQASIIRRSFAIVNDNICVGVNSTNMQCYADVGNFTWNIDFNTSITGADLAVLDDFEVIGDIRLRDSDGEVHSFNRELEIRDELYNNIIESTINTSYNLSTANLSIIGHDNKNIFVILNEVNFNLGTPTDSIILTEGTNTTPIFNHVFYSGSNPVLSKSTSTQEDVSDLAQMLLGAGFDYGSIAGSATNDKFIRGVYNRFFDDGALYKSGFDINVSSLTINISTGTMKILLDNFDIYNNHSTDDMVVEIHSDGDFHQHINDFDGFDSYGTGEAIGNNKYANIICGISATESRGGVMYCIIQDKPTVEHNKLGLAENDNTFLNFFPNNELIKKLFVPVVRVVIKRTGGTNTIQTLSTGDLFFDVRGITSGAGSPPTPGIKALSQLDIDTNYDGGLYNTTNDWGFFNSINVFGIIEADTFTDGTLTITGGSISGAVNIQSQQLHASQVLEVPSGTSPSGDPEVGYLFYDLNEGSTGTLMYYNVNSAWNFLAEYAFGSNNFFGSGNFTTTGKIKGGNITDGITSIVGGNYANVGNITGTDIDIQAGTGDYTSTGTLTSPTVANHPHPSMKTTASPSFVNLAIGSNDGDKLSIIGSVATFEAKFVDEDIVFLAVDDAESIILSGWQSFNLGGAILAGIVDFTMTGKLSINNMFYVESTGDTYWAGAGSGLVFSQIYTQGGSSTLVLPAQDTWYQITAFTINGDSNGATPDHTNDHITIPIRGKYLTQSSLAISSATTNEYVFEIQVGNGGFGIVNTDGRRTTTNADEVYTTNGMSSIVEFWGAETVELWIKRIDGGAVSSTIKIVDASITLNQVGG